MSLPDLHHCVTCSDEGVPMVIERLQPDGLAVCVDEEGEAQDVMTDLVGGVEPGETVLVHAGVALARVDERPEDVRR